MESVDVGMSQYHAFITGQVNTHESLDSINSNPRQVGFQETPVSDSFRHFTKFSKKINDVDEFEVTLKSNNFLF